MHWFGWNHVLYWLLWEILDSMLIDFCWISSIRNPWNNRMVLATVYSLILFLNSNCRKIGELIHFVSSLLKILRLLEDLEHYSSPTSLVASRNSPRALDRMLCRPACLVPVVSKVGHWHKRQIGLLVLIPLHCKPQEAWRTTLEHIPYAAGNLFSSIRLWKSSINTQDISPGDWL